MANGKLSHTEKMTSTKHFVNIVSANKNSCGRDDFNCYNNNMNCYHKIHSVRRKKRSRHCNNSGFLRLNLKKKKSSFFSGISLFFLFSFFYAQVHMPGAHSRVKTVQKGWICQLLVCSSHHRAERGKVHLSNYYLTQRSPSLTPLTSQWPSRQPRRKRGLVERSGTKWGSAQGTVLPSRESARHLT